MRIGEPFVLDGVEVQLSLQTWRNRSEFIAEPTRVGKESVAYLEMRQRLGDDWLSDLTWSENLVAYMFEAGLVDDEISAVLAEASR